MVDYSIQRGPATRQEFKRRDVSISFEGVRYALRDGEWHSSVDVISAGGRLSALNALLNAGKVRARPRGAEMEWQLA